MTSECLFEILFFFENRTQLFYFFLGKFLIRNVCGQHSCDISIIKTLQERTAFLPDIFIFIYQRGIDEHPALLFVGKGAFCHKALDQCLYGLWAPGSGS